jgi:hypothetical protein
MKTKLFMTLAFITATLLFTYCDHVNEGEEIDQNVVGSDRISSEYRSPAPFRGIRIQNFGNVFVTQEQTQSLKIEADDNIIKDVITTVENGVLSVGLRGKSYSNITLHVYASMPTIEKLLIDGAGNIVVEKPITSTDITASINGTGNLSLKGVANYLTCTINGAGNINAFDFLVNKCTALINGTGNCELNVSRELTASITGTGKIIYDGNPATLNSSISGSGKIVKK